MPRPLLPRLIQDPRIQPPGKAGQWITMPQGSNFLANLAASLTAEDGQRTGHPEILSIPDPWATVTVFANALTYPGHHFHAACQRQWRGLLAMVALAPQRQWQLQVRTLSIKDQASAREQTPAKGQASAGRPRSFASVAHRMAPPVSAFGQDWDRIGLMILKERIVGLMVPSTLVCPVRNLDGAVGDIVPWARDGELHDPCHCEELSTADFALLARTIGEWLQVWQAQDAASPSAGPTGRALLGELSLFHRALLDKSTAAAMPFRRTDQQSGFMPPDGPAYAVLKNRWTLSREENPASEAVLSVRAPFSRMRKGAILFDPAMADSQDLHLLPVWERRTAAEINRSPDRSALARDIARAGYMLVTPDDLFMPGDTIHRLDFAARWHGEGANQNYLLPFSPMVFLFLTPEELAGRVRIHDDDGSVTVTLDLDLTDSAQGRWTSYRMSRVYREVATSNTRGSVQLWPDFKADHWPVHYGFSTTFDSGLLRTLAFANSDDIGNWLSAPDPSNPPLLASLAQVQADPRRRYSANGIDVVRLTRAPEAALFLRPENAPSGRPPGSWEIGNSYAGLALITQPKRDSDPDAGWTVGLDFGTSNTVVYHRTANDDHPRPVTFNNRLDHVFTLSVQREKERGELAALEFLPPAAVEMPFQTLLASRSPGVWHEHPLLSHYIRYVVSPFAVTADWIAGMNAEAGAAAAGIPLSNLKWLEGEKAPKLRTLFLSQAVIQTLAEAAHRGVPPGNVRWRFSYPEALGHRRFQSFRDEIIPRSLALSDLLEPPQGTPTLRTESTCALLYFHHREQIHLMGSFLFLDIGGETTDIFLWQGSRAVWRSSLRLAGRHLLTEFLKRNRQLLERLEESIPGRSASAGRLFDLCGNDPRNPALGTALEMIVNSCDFSTDYLKRAQKSFAATPAVKRLNFVVTLGLLGIFHYIAMAIRSLSQADPDAAAADGQPFLRNDTLRVFIGGRASLLFRSMLTETMEGHLRTYFRERAGLGAALAPLSYSRDPKSEAAYGLLVDTDVVRNIEEVRASLTDFLGLDVVVDGRTFPAATPPQALFGNTANTISLPGEAEIRAVFAEANRIAGTSISLPEDAWHEVFGHIRDRLFAIMNRTGRPDAADGQEVSAVAPPFISGLAALIDRVICQNESEP